MFLDTSPSHAFETCAALTIEEEGREQRREIKTFLEEPREDLCDWLDPKGSLSSSLKDRLLYECLDQN